MSPEVTQKLMSKLSSIRTTKEYRNEHTKRKKTICVPYKDTRHKVSNNTIKTYEAAQRAISHTMEDDKLWKIMTLNAWNVALNAKTEMKDFEQLNYGFECLIVYNGSERLWKWWLWTPKTMALNAYENVSSERLWEKWLWKVVALNTYGSKCLWRKWL